jgi:predicted Zn-dependent protease
MKIAIVLIAIFLFSCEKVPLTNREQLNLVPQNELIATSYTQYGDFLSKNTVISNTYEAQSVQRVGTRIQKAVEQYFAQNNLSDRLKGYNWEFHLVKDSTVNAWCMPGGKVVVYSGILPLTQNDAGLAVVLGHEISHAVANHGNERLSQQLLVQLGAASLQTALAQEPALTQQIFMGAFGVGSEVGVLLPYSRTQEAEADHLGLIFMAMAGYDPHEALDFWQRMKSQSQGAPPEILSTHPADQRRIDNIRSLIPEAMKYYRQQTSMSHRGDNFPESCRDAFGIATFRLHGLAEEN